VCAVGLCYRWSGSAGAYASRFPLCPRSPGGGGGKYIIIATRHTPNDLRKHHFFLFCTVATGARVPTIPEGRTRAARARTIPEGRARARRSITGARGPRFVLSNSTAAELFTTILPPPQIRLHALPPSPPRARPPGSPRTFLPLPSPPPQAHSPLPPPVAALVGEA